jgi:predicted metal-dependent peptidase
MDAKLKLSAARAAVLVEMPYYADILYGVEYVEAPGLGTLGVTYKGHILYDREVIEAWSVPQIAAVLRHECGHLLRDHKSRCELACADEKLWNIAGDAEINDDEVKAKSPLPGEPVLPSKLGMPDGLTAEEYYGKLRDQQGQQDKAQGESADGAPGEGEAGEGEGQGDPQDGPAEGEGKGTGGKGQAAGEQKAGTGSGAGQPGDKPGAGEGWCGSAAGRALPGEDALTGGRTEVELEEIRVNVAEAMVTHASSGRGTVPGGWLRWAEKQIAPPKIPWQQKLARALRASVATKAGAVDYRWNKPSRRQAGVGFEFGSPILPALRAPIPRVVVLGDTSGSMGTAEMEVVVREGGGVIKAVGAEVEFGAVDTKLHTFKKVRDAREMAGLLVGGGGTDFRQAFEEVLKPRREGRPDVIVFVTDGQASIPEHAPVGVQVIWVLCGGCRTHSMPWGECVEVED